jgi:hypothetical protein
MDSPLLAFRKSSVRGALVALLVVFVLVPIGCLHGDGEAKRPEGTSEPKERPRLARARLRQLGLTRDVPAPVTRACTEARRAATVRVICPRLIPDAPLSRIAGLGGGAMVLLDERRFYELDFNSAGGRAGKRVQHWITGGGQAGVVKRWVLTDGANEVKGNPTLVRQVDIAGRRVHVYRYPPYPAGGINGSHWAAFVTVGDELVFASVHGRRYVDAAVAMAVDLAEQAARVPPPPADYPVVVHDFTITYCGGMSVALNSELWLAEQPADASAGQRPVLRETGPGTFVILSGDRSEFRARSGKITHFRRAEPGTPDPWKRCE